MHEIIREYRAGKISNTEAKRQLDGLVIVGRITPRSAAAYKANLEDVRSGIMRPERETDSAIRLGMSAMDDVESHGESEIDRAVAHVFNLHYRGNFGKHYRLTIAFHHEAATGNALGCEAHRMTLDEKGNVIDKQTRPRRLPLITKQDGLARSGPCPLPIPKLGSYRFVLDPTLHEHMKAVARTKMDGERCWVFRLQETAWRQLVSRHPG